jgi:hypothetical protein
VRNGPERRHAGRVQAVPLEDRACARVRRCGQSVRARRLASCSQQRGDAAASRIVAGAASCRRDLGAPSASLPTAAPRRGRRRPAGAADQHVDAAGAALDRARVEQLAEFLDVLAARCRAGRWRRAVGLGGDDLLLSPRDRVGAFVDLAHEAAHLVEGAAAEVCEALRDEAEALAQRGCRPARRRRAGRGRRGRCAAGRPRRTGP